MPSVNFEGKREEKKRRRKKRPPLTQHCPMWKEVTTVVEGGEHCHGSRCSSVG
jgi:hypothetical protein